MLISRLLKCECFCWAACFACSPSSLSSSPSSSSLSSCGALVNTSLRVSVSKKEKKSAIVIIMDVFQAVLIDALRSHFPKLHETIRLNLLRGRVDLRNIDLTESPPFVLSDLPFRISHGLIANLSLRIPWRGLRNSLITAHVKDLTLTCEYIPFPSSQHAVFNAFDTQSHQRKLRLLAEEEMLQSPLSSILQKMVPKALARLKVIIENATLRLILPDGHVFHISISNITISPNTTSSESQELRIDLSSCLLQLSKHDSEAEPLKMAVSSFSAYLQHSNDSIVLSFSFPDPVQVNVDSSIIRFLSMTKSTALNWADAYRFSRPNSSTSENPHEWFLYAYRRIRSRYAHLNNLSVEMAQSTCRTFLEYYRLHVIRLRRNKELSGSTVSRLAELETVLTTDAISSLRASARKEVMAEDVSSFATREWLRWALFNNEMSLEREELANEVRKSLQAVDSGRSPEVRNLDCVTESASSATTGSESLLSSTRTTRISGDLIALNISVSSKSKSISFCLEGFACSGLYSSSNCEHTATLKMKNIQVYVDKDLVGRKGICNLLNSPYSMSGKSDTLPFIEVMYIAMVSGDCSLKVAVRPFHVLMTTRAVRTVIQILQNWLDAFTTLSNFSGENLSKRNGFISEFSLEAECGTSVSLVCNELLFPSEELLTLSFFLGGISLHFKRDKPSEVQVNGAFSAATFRRKSSNIFDIVPCSETVLSTAVKVLLKFEDTMILHFRQLDGFIDILVISQLLMTATNLQTFVVALGLKNQEHSVIFTNSDINNEWNFSPMELRIDSAKATVRFGTNEDKKSAHALFYDLKLTVSQGKQWNCLLKSCCLSELAHGNFLNLSTSSCDESALSVSCGFLPPSSEDYHIESNLGILKVSLTLPGIQSIMRLGKDVRAVAAFLTADDGSSEQRRTSMLKVNGSFEVQSVRIGLHDMDKKLEFGCNAFHVTLFDDAVSGSVQVLELVGEENNQPIGRPILQIPSIPSTFASARDHVALSFRLSGYDNQIVIESLCINLTDSALNNVIDLGTQVSTTISSELTPFSDGVIVDEAEKGNKLTKLVVSCRGLSIFIHHEMDVIVIRAGFLSSSTERNLFSMSVRGCGLSVNYGSSDICSSIRMVDKFSSTMLEDVDWNLRNAYRAKECHTSNSNWNLRFLDDVRVRIIPDDLSKILSVALHFSETPCFKNTVSNSVDLDAERQSTRQRTLVEVSLPRLYVWLLRSSNRNASIGFIEMNELDVQSRSERNSESDLAFVQTLIFSCRSIACFEVSPRKKYIARLRVGLPDASTDIRDRSFMHENNSVRVEIVSRIDYKQKTSACDILLDNLKVHYDESSIGVFLSFADEIQRTMKLLFTNRGSITDTPAPSLQDQSLASTDDSITRLTVRLEHSHIAVLTTKANQETIALVLSIQGINCCILVSTEGMFYQASHMKLQDAALSLSRWSTEGDIYTTSSLELGSFDVDHIFTVDEISTKGSNPENLSFRDCISRSTIASVQAASFRVDPSIPKKFSLYITEAHVIANIHDVAQAVHMIMSTFFVGQDLRSEFSLPHLSISVQGICFRITVKNGTKSNQPSGGFIAGVDGVLQCAIYQGGKDVDGRLKVAAFIEETKGSFRDDVLQSTTLKIIMREEGHATISIICERLLRISISPNSVEAISVLSREIGRVTAIVTDIVQPEERETATEDTTSLLLNIELPGLILRLLSNTPRTQLLRLSIRKVIFLYAIGLYTKDIRLKISDFLLEDTSPWRMFSRYHEANDSKWSRIISAYHPKPINDSNERSSSHFLSMGLLSPRTRTSGMLSNDRSSPSSHRWQRSGMADPQRFIQACSRSLFAPGDHGL